MEVTRDMPVIRVLHLMKPLSSAVDSMLTAMFWAVVPVYMVDIRKAWIAIDSIRGKRHNMPWFFVVSRHGPRKFRFGREYFAPMAILDQVPILVLLDPVGIGNHVTRFNEPVDARSTGSGRFRRRIRHKQCS